MTNEGLIGELRAFARRISASRHIEFAGGEEARMASSAAAEIERLSSREAVLREALEKIGTAAKVETAPMVFIGTRIRREHYKLRLALADIQYLACAALSPDGGRDGE